MPHPTPTLILIGLRGSGKTTIARLLAAHLRRPAIDLDDITPTHLNEQTAAEALRNHGEPAFRQAELSALRDTLAKHPGSILALGGGTPTAPGARELLDSEMRAGRAVIIYLRAAEHTLRSRLANTPLDTRPSLTGKGAVEEIGELLARRDPHYAALASIVIDVDTLDAQAASDAIIATLP